jgi:hypothetical protein
MAIKSNYALILNRLAQMQRAPYYATGREELALAEQTIVELETKCNSLQAKLDALMLEFCPDQMTEEQVKIWADAQSHTRTQEAA